MSQAPQLSAYYQYLLSDPGLQSILSLAGCVSDPSWALVQKHIRIATKYFVNQDQREGTDNKHKSDVMVPDLLVKLIINSNTSKFKI